MSGRDTEQESAMNGYKVQQKMSGRNKRGDVLLPVLLLSFCLVRPTYGVCYEHCSQCESDDCRACSYGYWGETCDLLCINCWGSGCEKQSGRCFQCELGFFGEHCDKYCPENCWSSKYNDPTACNRHSGSCLDGCIIGWWGEQCQNRCSARCRGACYQHDGACVNDCTKGFFGRFCNKRCSPGCTEGSCSWLTGNCHGGCKCGYTGINCIDTCSINCNTPCKLNVKSQCLTCVYICEGHCLSGRCYQNSSCIDGCQDGFYGDQCRQPCPPDCSDCDGRKDCLSCFYEMTSEICHQMSKDENSEIEMDVKPKLSGGGSLRTMSFILPFSCLLGVQSL